MQAFVLKPRLPRVKAGRVDDPECRGLGSSTPCALPRGRCHPTENSWLLGVSDSFFSIFLLCFSLCAWFIFPSTFKKYKYCISLCFIEI